MKKIVLFASGSGSNVENIANYFKNANLSIECVYCNNPDAFVFERCKKLDIPATLFNKEEFKNGTVLKQLENIQPDLIVLAGFLWLIPKDFVSAFPDKIINIHPALLPKFGGKGMYGMKVHEAVVENKESETGISIHFVNEHYDEGNIILQEKVAVTQQDSPEDVAKNIHELEYKFFPIAIEKLLFS